MRSYDHYRKNLKVLFVKSNSYSRSISLKVLEENFNNVTIAENGLDGYMKFLKYKNDEEKCFDLIISEINIPKINGIEMLEKIRTVDDVPFIFLTTDNNHTTVLKAIKLNILSYIIKPLNVASVAKSINKSCRKLYKQYTQKLKSDESLA